MLHHTLKQLMENVRHDWKKYVCEWKQLPEKVIDRFKTQSVICYIKHKNLCIRKTIGVHCWSLNTGCKHLVFSKFAWANLALGALTIVQYTIFVLLWSLYQVHTMTSSHMENWMVCVQWFMCKWCHFIVSLYISFLFYSRSYLLWQLS